MEYKHIEQESSNGFVRISIGGEVLAEHETFQHNKNYSNQNYIAQELVAQVLDGLRSKV